MDFIEPDEQRKIPRSDVLKNLLVSPEKKEWLSPLLHEELTSDFVDNLSSFTNGINEEDDSDFMLSILFDFSVSNPENFIESKLLSERVKIIPALFTEKMEGKPSIFKSSVANILYNIKDCTKENKNFDEAYQKKLQEIRASSSSAERTCFYIKQLNLPKRTYKEDEKPPTLDEIPLLFNAEWCLIEELEELEEIIIDDVDHRALPFLVYGKEAFTCIRNALFFFKFKSVLDKDRIEKIKIPQWNEKNYIHEIYFVLALISNDKDILKLILDKIFEGVNPVDIPYIFFGYIENHVNSIYGVLLKGRFSDVIKPIRAELEYLDWALTEDTNYPHKIYFEKSRLFLDYIDKISHSALEDKLELFQELCFKRAGGNHHFQTGRYWGLGERTIKDTLDRIAQEIIRGEIKFPECKKEANDLYEEFVDVIAKGAAKYPVELFLSEGRINIPNDYGLVVFKRYCEKLELKNTKDALFVSEFWFKYFYLKQSFFSSVNSSSGRYSSTLEKEAPFFYKNVFCKFINDEDFICRFLSIPQKSSSTLSLAVYCLARWVLYPKNDDENMSDVFNEASRLLHDEKITFPDKITEFIRSYKIPDGITDSFWSVEIPTLLGKGYENEARRFLFYLTAALGGEQYQNILKKLYKAEEHYPLFYIRYKYSRENFMLEEFLDFLSNSENPSLRGNKNEFYNLELLQEACKKNVLKKQIVLEKVSDYIKENRKILFQSSTIKYFIKYFFIEIEEGEPYEARMTFFTQFCERAIQENEDSYTELNLLFKICRDFRHIDTILAKHTDINNSLVIRCCKMLNNLKKNIVQNDFPEDEYTFLNDYIFPASNFIWERTGNIWKALKPLILAFRASKNILLDESLKTINNISYSLLNMITSFFSIEDNEKLKELRYNMANDFAEYLKPTKNERQAEKYTQKERETEGFDPSYTEPSSYWRYAYIRALGDLGVKTDKRGHYFHKILEKVSEEDPSEDVKSAAKKVMEELDTIRKGYSGANHKKCLFEAFWWLKNAHMLSLGGKIDSKKALELRIIEWR